MTKIPDIILDRLEEYRDILRYQGSIVEENRKYGPVWRLRFRSPRGSGGPIQKNIPLGSGPEVVEAVRELIASWQLVPRKKRGKKKARKRKVKDVEQGTRQNLIQMFKDMAKLLKNADEVSKGVVRKKRSSAGGI